MKEIDLSEYIERNANRVSRKVSLKNFFRIFSRLFNRRPILVIYSLKIHKQIYFSSASGLYGGNWKEYIAILKKWVKDFHELNIEPVFYFNGISKNDLKKGTNWKRVHLPERKQVIVDDPLIDLHTDDQRCTIPPGISSYIRYILKYECKCRVYNTVDNSLYEVAKYANCIPECLGILCDKLDCLFFNTKPVFYSKYFDLLKDEGKIYYRSLLIDLLTLKPKQLPLFACISMNVFRKGETYKEQLNIIENIVGTMKEYQWYGKKEEIPYISRVTYINERMLNTYLDMYRLRDIFNNKKNKNIISKIRKCEAPGIIYKLLTFKEYAERITISDSSQKWTPSILAFRPIRQKMYSLLFRNRPVCITERCICGENEDEEIVNNVLIESNVPVIDCPTLENLWFGRKQCLVQKRWVLFSKCLNLTIPLPKLCQIENAFIVLCSLLNYLLKLKDIELKPEEVKAFIIQAISVSFEDTSKFSNIKAPEDTRIVYLISLFQKGISNLLYLLSVCGCPIPLRDAMPWKYFDGKSFAYFLEKLQNNSHSVESCCEDNTEIIEIFRKLYEITIIGTSLENEENKV
ncbi:constitutive coactivator of peroxisome proliferator-activated receptor gamma-like isoform X2 [Centruroides sculpturatus]|uniref:constitutive coactivator of peroxisome proliferator-activated receptor gamma-like isoform X2 n=1 Tax=Centruroides sculpturatus TaxID=218467 RepID=UPI000C6CCFE8|nr:constitutive coactivator of peroxisome proliferator-activated receptor gamma-like isoform X2 [Centruroides sculpturatus]